MRKRDHAGRSAQGRALLFLVIWFGCLCAVAVRLAWIQVAKAETIAARAEHLSIRTVLVPARRGEVLDRSGDRLAISIETRRVIVDPTQLDDPREAARSIARVLGLDATELERKFARDTRYCVVAEKVPLEKASRLADERIKGVYFRVDYRRVYPYRALLGPVLGYVNKRVDEATGVELGRGGVEYVYNELLAGKPGYVKAQFDSCGLPIPGTEVERVEPLDGLHLALTIDREVQYAAERELEKAIEAHEASSGVVIVMDPRNGDILAMASLPGFDPNEYNRVRDQGRLLNRAIGMTYEPGSTLKALTVAAAIEEGVVAPDTKLYLPEKLKVGRHTIGEAHHRPAGAYSVRDILAHSYNIGAVRIGQMLGPERLYERLKGFGLGEKTGIDLNGEQCGYLPPVDGWAPTTMANIPFGQGVATTPLQVLRAVAAFANGGIMPNPHVMKYSRDPSTSNVRPWEPEPGRKVVSKQTAAIMTHLLTSVVDEGTGSNAAIPGYTVAGKTGTAQMANPNGRGYLKGHYVASFVGYAPAPDPAFAMIVVIVDPKKGHYGGEVAAPVFREVGKVVLQRLRVPPDRSGTDATTTNRVTAD